LHSDSADAVGRERIGARARRAGNGISAVLTVGDKEHAVARSGRQRHLDSEIYQHRAGLAAAIENIAFAVGAEFEQRLRARRTQEGSGEAASPGALEALVGESVSRRLSKQG